MKKLLFWAFILAVGWYLWGGSFASAVESWLTDDNKPSVPCEVKGMECGDLVRMLNSMRPGRYYEASSRLLGVSTEDMTLFREGIGMVFVLQNGIKLVHNQGISNPEKGYLTVIFPNKHRMKFDDKGKFVSEEG